MMSMSFSMTLCLQGAAVDLSVPAARSVEQEPQRTEVSGPDAAIDTGTTQPASAPTSSPASEPEPSVPPVPTTADHKPVHAERSPPPSRDASGQAPTFSPWVDLRILDTDSHVELGLDYKTKMRASKRGSASGGSRFRMRVFALAGKQDKDKPLSEFSAIAPDMGAGASLGADWGTVRSRVESCSAASGQSDCSSVGVYGLYVEPRWTVARLPYQPADMAEEVVVWGNSWSVSTKFRLLTTGGGREVSTDRSVEATGEGAAGAEISSRAYKRWLHGLTLSLTYARQYKAKDAVAIFDSEDLDCSTEDGIVSCNGALTAPVRIVDRAQARPKLGALIHYAFQPPRGSLAYGAAFGINGKGDDKGVNPFAKETRLRFEAWFYYFAWESGSTTVVRLGVAPFVDAALGTAKIPLLGGAVLALRAASSRLEY